MLINITKKNRNIIDILFVFLVIFLFTIPVFFFGINDLEDYNYGYFSSYIINEENLNPYIFFSDKIGPGINFPMSSGIFFSSFLIFFDNIRFFIF